MSEIAPALAELNYVDAECTSGRRYISMASEVSTVVPDRRVVPMYNGRGTDFTLERNGFVFRKHCSQIRDFDELSDLLARSVLDNAHLLAGQTYAAEACSFVQGVTGADLVLTSNCVFRRANGEAENFQPVAGDVHSDYVPHQAARFADEALERNGMVGRKYRRFIATSLWRAISPPPQDWPLAVCDFQTVDDGEGIYNYIIFSEGPPTLTDLALPLEDPFNTPAAYIYHYNLDHRWYFFPSMTRDEVILLKLFDSDHTDAWRAPHTAFLDRAAKGAHRRESIEFRSVAYFFD
jgi:hypothetical protein